MEPYSRRSLPVALLSTGIYLLSPRIAVFCRCSVGLLFFAQLFHECLDIDVVQFYLCMIVALLLISFIPDISLAIPKLLGGYEPTIPLLFLK